MKSPPKFYCVNRFRVASAVPGGEGFSALLYPYQQKSEFLDVLQLLIKTHLHWFWENEHCRNSQGSTVNARFEHYCGRISERTWYGKLGDLFFTALIDERYVIVSFQVFRFQAEWSGPPPFPLKRTGTSRDD